MQTKLLNQLPSTSARYQGGNDGDRSNQNVSAFVVIPYFNNDMGRPGIERPLISSIVSWLCPSIVVNGQPGKNAFVRGAATTVTVDVANWGAGALSTPVYVRVWWSDPSTGFTTLNLFGQSTIAVPNGGVRRTQPIVGTIPISAPAHVCLLVNIWSPLETTSNSSAINPTNDRHWAQLNICDVEATIKRPFQLIFWAGNPLNRAAPFEIVARPVAQEALPMLERVRRAEALRVEQLPVQIRELPHLEQAAKVFGSARGKKPLQSVDLNLLQPETGRSKKGASQDYDGRSQCRLTLNPGERRAIHLMGKLPPDTPPGTNTVFEIVSIRLGDHEQEMVGSLGVVVTAGND